jgi:hypothetical protein
MNMCFVRMMTSLTEYVPPEDGIVYVWNRNRTTGNVHNHHNRIHCCWSSWYIIRLIESGTNVGHEIGETACTIRCAQNLLWTRPSRELSLHVTKILNLLLRISLKCERWIQLAYVRVRLIRKFGNGSFVGINSKEYLGRQIHKTLRKPSIWYIWSVTSRRRSMISDPNSPINPVQSNENWLSAFIMYACMNLVVRLDFTVSKLNERDTSLYTSGLQFQHRHENNPIMYCMFQKHAYVAFYCSAQALTLLET